MQKEKVQALAYKLYTIFALIWFREKEIEQNFNINKSLNAFLRRGLAPLTEVTGK